MKKLALLLGLVFLGSTLLHAAKTPFRAVVTKLRGKAFVQTQEGAPWQKCYVSMVLDENAKVKTNRWSKATIMLSDRSKIQVKGNSQIKLSSLSEEDRIVEQEKGKSIFRIAKLWRGRKFRCKTPVAVCSVRGTEFAVEVGDDNLSTFKVFSGLVNVSPIDESFDSMYGDAIGDALGDALDTIKTEIPVSPNEKIDIDSDDAASAAAPEPVAFEEEDTQEQSDIVKEEVQEVVGVEVSADMTKEAIQQAAADEVRLAEYENKKTIIDMFGNRVKIEEYVIRPAADEIKMVVLNERTDRYDYFTNHRKFNTTLPDDMSVANQSWYTWQTGSKTSQPDYYLEENKMAASNTADVVEWGYTSGQIVTSGSGYAHSADTYMNIIAGGQTLVVVDEASSINRISNLDITFPLAGGTGDMYEKNVATLDNGLTFTEEYYLVSDLGDPPTSSEHSSLLTDISNGDTSSWLSWNQELVLKYDGFTGPGGKIDLCVEPQIFKDAGLVPSN